MKHCWVLQGRAFVNDGFGRSDRVMSYDCKQCGAKFDVRRSSRERSDKVRTQEWEIHGIVECDIQMAKTVMGS